LHKGYNLSISGDSGKYLGYLYAGTRIFDAQMKAVRQRLNQFVLPDGLLDATKLGENWFPRINADVFISHSHADRDLALGFAGFLADKFDLTSFIDSCVWGFGDELLKAIDKKYCYQPESKTYSYEKRNRSTSHVHMMLSTALSSMIDHCECLFFMNTPGSITPLDVIGKDGDGTLSPWIYSEIAFSRLVRRKLTPRTRPTEKAFTKVARELSEQIQILYSVEMDHLSSLRSKDLDRWHLSSMLSKDHPLDVLYRM
jgi:hypothetical protein